MIYSITYFLSFTKHTKERAIWDYANMMTCTKMKDDLSKFGIDADKYIKYMDTPNKSPTPETSNCRPKVIWDYFFYNTSK